jgi:hypothetical protein
MKTQTPKPVLWAFVIWALACLAIIFCSCNTPRHVQKKDQAAYERVMGNDSLLAKVGKRIRVEGATKTEVVTVTKTDTIFEPIEKPVPVEGCEGLTAFIDDIEFFTLEPKTYKRDGVTVSIDKNGVIINRTNTTTVKTVENLGMVADLTDSVDKYKNILLAERFENSRTLQRLQAAEAENRALKEAAKTKGLKWYWWVLIVAAALGAISFAVLKKAAPWAIILKAITTLFSLIKKKKQ